MASPGCSVAPPMKPEVLPTVRGDSSVWIVPPRRWSCGQSWIETVLFSEARREWYAFSILSLMICIWTLEFLLMLLTIHSSSTGAVSFMWKSCTQRRMTPPSTSS